MILRIIKLTNMVSNDFSSFCMGVFVSFLAITLGLFAGGAMAIASIPILFFNSPLPGEMTTGNVVSVFLLGVFLFVTGFWVLMLVLGEALEKYLKTKYHYSSITEALEALKKKHEGRTPLEKLNGRLRKKWWVKLLVG